MGNKWKYYRRGRDESVQRLLDLVNNLRSPQEEPIVEAQRFLLDTFADLLETGIEASKTNRQLLIIDITDEAKQ